MLVLLGIHHTHYVCSINFTVSLSMIAGKTGKAADDKIALKKQQTDLMDFWWKTWFVVKNLFPNVDEISLESLSNFSSIQLLPNFLQFNYNKRKERKQLDTLIHTQFHVEKKENYEILNWRKVCLISLIIGNNRNLIDQMKMKT